MGAQTKGPHFKFKGIRFCAVSTDPEFDLDEIVVLNIFFLFISGIGAGSILGKDSVDRNKSVFILAVAVVI